MNIEQAFDAALQHHLAGRLAEAEAGYRQILAIQPRHVDALHLLGVVACLTGRGDLAVELITQALALRPEFSAACYNLGNAFRSQGQLDQAIAAFRQAVALQPDFPAAHYNLGNSLHDSGRVGEAIAAYRQTIALQAGFPRAHYNLGNSLHSQGQWEEALAAYRQALALEPDFPEAHSNLGKTLRETGKVEEGIAAYRQAIALRPGFPDAHKDLGMALLLTGNFSEGWQEYEWRWPGADFASAWGNFTQPAWDGGSLEGRTILLHAEQGLGDALQFIRYLPLVAQRGGRIVLECQPELQRLFRIMHGDLAVVVRGEPLPSFDVHAPLLSLPRLFATDLASIPQNVPYLPASAADAALWHDRLAAHSSVLKVGLVWAGRPTHANDRNRSISLASFAPLAQIPGVRFVSLQKGEASAQAREPSAELPMTDWTDELHDFADTAALLANLDLVLSVDTAVAHLAGAMGKPVWVLLPFVPDWRWLLARADSPWYPTMRMFRQPRLTDWGSVILEVQAHLQRLVHGFF